MKNFFKRLFGQPQQTNSQVSTLSTQTHNTAEDTSLVGDVNAVVVSDLGNIRANNEDTGMFVRLADEGLRRVKGYLLLVADGMGGHLAGEVASQMAAEIVSREYFQHHESIEKSLLRAFQIANQHIFDESRMHVTFRGMGTTCTAVVVQNQQLYYAHVGDSRAYLFKQGQLIRMTEDHTYVQELLRQGEINEQAAATHPERNVLTQAMGTKADLRIDLGRCILPLDPGDRLLLCSDGLYEYCREDDLIQILKQGSLLEAAEELVKTAKDRGGHDNITVVVAERTSVDLETEPRETREIDIPLTRDLGIPND